MAVARRLGEYFFEVIMRRHETRSTMMTSNRPLEEWGKLIADVPAATAILDRFLHHADIITITGRSYRLKDRSSTSQTTTTNGNRKTAGTVASVCLLIVEEAIEPGVARLELATFPTGRSVSELRRPARHHYVSSRWRSGARRSQNLPGPGRSCHGRTIGFSGVRSLPARPG